VQRHGVKLAAVRQMTDLKEVKAPLSFPRGCGIVQPPGLLHEAKYPVLANVDDRKGPVSAPEIERLIGAVDMSDLTSVQANPNA
jgi:hypothetical protein